MKRCAWFTKLGRQCVTSVGEPNFPKDDPKIALCGQHRRTATEWFVPNPPPNIGTEESFIYFIWNRQTEMIKIGRSVNPVQRIRGLESQAGTKYTTLLVMPETDVFTERDAHSEAEAYRLQGTEWFEAGRAMFEWIGALQRYVDDESEIRSASFPELQEVS